MRILPIASKELEKYASYDGHEEVVACHDSESGMYAIIAVHNRNRGPALGGCRFYSYKNRTEAMEDVLRLSRGMTYKNALANLPLGGAKAVIMGDPAKPKSEKLFRAFGRFVESLEGRYVTAEDVNVDVADMKIVAEETKHVVGIKPKPTKDGMRSGDPSIATARGVYVGIRAALKYWHSRQNVEDTWVAIQGLGHVGYHLARMLHEGGAQLFVTDMRQDVVDKAVQDFGAIAVGLEKIYEVPADIYAPCALGAVINDKTIPLLHQAGNTIVAGSANNQLAEPRHGRELWKNGILYAPDFVINAGGVIDVSYDLDEFDREDLLKHLDGIGDTLTEIFERVSATSMPSNEIAEILAEARFKD